MISLSASPICPKCGCSLGEDAPKGLCAKCLIANILDREPTMIGLGSLPRDFATYSLLEEIARGGMGIVYRARQQPINRFVALKVMVGGQFAAPDFVERFRIEADAAASLDHPNIVPIYEAGEYEGQPFFSMKLIEGQSLAHRLASLESPMPKPEAADLLAKLARAVHFAHQRGILHRDIKPGNVLLDALGEPYLTDFGLAKLVENDRTLTRTIAMLGTPSYMSPEQARGEAKELTTAVDVYGLGAILYELLTGQPPFAGGTTMETVRQVLEREPRLPSLLNPNVDRDLDTICLKCLEKDPSRRYGSAEALATDLDRWRCHEPILARPSTPLERTAKWIRRNRGAFAALSVIALLLAAGTSVSTWLALKESKAWKEEFKQRIVAQNAQAQAIVMQKKAEAATMQADANLRQAEWLVYAGKLRLAQTDLEFANGGLAERYLTECQENLRGWEYRYLSERMKAHQTLLGHTGRVMGVAFSPDGRHIATASEDGTAKVWVAATGREIVTLRGHKGLIQSVAFSPDSQRIATSGGEWGLDKIPGEAMVWDATTGRLLLDLKGHNYSVWNVAFSADGQHLVTGAGDLEFKAGEVKMWDTVTGREIFTLTDFPEGLCNVAISPNGQRLITVSARGTSKVWDAVTQQPLFPLIGHKQQIKCATFSLDGQRILTGSWDCAAIVWDAATGEPLFTRKGHKEAVTCVAFSPNGQQFLTGSRDQTTKLWNSSKDEEIFTLKGHAGIVRGVTFSPDSQWIVTGSEDRTAKSWDAIRGQEVPILQGHSDFVSSIAFSPDSQRIVTGSGDGLAKVWDTATEREIFSINGITPRPWTEAAVWTVAFSPDGQRIVTGSQDTTVKVWDAATGRELLTLPHAHIVSSAAFSPDGQRIVTGVGAFGPKSKEPGETKVWDIATGRELLSLSHASGVLGVAFSPDGQRIVSASNDGTARVSDATTGRELLAFRHSQAVWSVAFSPDGRRIATGSWDHTAKVWDAQSGLEVFTLKGHTDFVRGVAFSPDGQRIATSSDDRTVKLWNATTGQEALTLPKHTEMVWSVAFSPDGLHLASGMAGARATVKVWSTAPPPITTQPQEKPAAEK